MAQSVSLHDHTTGKTGARHYFEFSERRFNPGSTTDWTICATATIFGLLDCAADSPLLDPRFRYQLNIICRLSDNITNHYPAECPYDITDKIAISEHDYSIYIEAQLGVGDDGNEPVVLPEPQGPGEDIGGFDPEIKDWDDVVVPVPI